MWVGRRKALPLEERGMSRAAGEGTLRVPSPDLIFPEDRIFSGARFAGIGSSLFYWGRNPLNWFCKPVGFRPVL